MNRCSFPGTKTKKELYSGEFETEWEFLKYVLIKCGVDEAVILKENESCEGGTFGNAFNSRKVTDLKGLEIKNGIYTNKYGKDTVMSELKKCGEYFRQAIDVFIDKK